MDSDILIVQAIAALINRWNYNSKSSFALA